MWGAVAACLDWSLMLSSPHLLRPNWTGDSAGLAAVERTRIETAEVRLGDCE